MADDEKPNPPRPSRVGAVARVLLLVAIIGSMIGASVSSGLLDDLTVQSVRAQVQAAGALGFVSYFAIFIGGQLMHLPGLIFIGAGVVAFGPSVGAPLAVIGGTLAVAINFAFVRVIGGQPLHLLRRRWVGSVLDLLERRPLLVVIGLRLFFFTSPALTALLALSNVRFRVHVLGSAIGMTPAVVLAAFFIDALL